MLTEILLDFALIGAEWVLWILVILAFVGTGVTIARIHFFAKRTLDIDSLRVRFGEHLEKREYRAAADLLRDIDAMEARVVLFGLRQIDRGAAAVEDLMTGAIATEKTRYEKGTPFLGTVGNNAPFIGLFGTVLGIIGAFANLAEGGDEASDLVMAAIAEALVATGVGLLVAIPAVIAYNLFKTRIKMHTARTELLGRTLLSHLRGGTDGGV